MDAALIIKRLSRAQRALVLSLPDDGRPRLLNHRESVSALAMERVQIEPWIFAQLTHHSYARGEGLVSYPCAHLTPLGLQIAARLKDPANV